MKLLDGKWLSTVIKDEIENQVKEYRLKGFRAPKLVAVLVGADPASGFYVKSKMRSCEKVGFESDVITLEPSISEQNLLELVDQLNRDEGVDGYIIQLPLPGHINEHKIIEAVEPAKDVDGFHPENIGKLAIGLDGFIPATPLGILKFLERYNIETEGKHAVVLGRSNIVGTPMSILLSRKNYPGNCTVTQVHSKTKDLNKKILEADIIVAAIGKAEMVKAEMVKEGAVVIDVGINRVEDSSKPKGYRIVGDVDFKNVAPKCSYITPVPGGVGLMTVTSLLLNTMKAYKLTMDLK